MVAVIGVVLAYHVIHHIDAMLLKTSGESSEQYYSAAALTRCLDTGAPNTPLTADALKSCLHGANTKPDTLDEIVTPRIEELKWLLTMIAYLGVFYTLAQVGATWFSAESYTKKVEEGLTRISDSLAKINTTYPLFEHVAELRKRSFEALDKVFTTVSRAPDSASGNPMEALDWSDNLFRKLGVEFRQGLLSAESFASVDLDVERTPDEHAELLRRLALFYRSKFSYEDNVTQGSFGDAERAEAYLILADKKKRDFTIKNDLGSTYITIYLAVKKRLGPQHKDAQYYLERSENAFTESAQIEPRQQRAYYNLAVIAGAHRRQFRRAAQILRNALDCDVWQRQPSDDFQSIIFYNMGCYESRILQEDSAKAAGPVTVEQAKEVVSFLRKAADLKSVRRNLIEEDFEEDPKADGDIAGLLRMADKNLKGELLKIRDDLLKKARELEITDDKRKASELSTVLHVRSPRPSKPSKKRIDLDDLSAVHTTSLQHTHYTKDNNASSAPLKSPVSNANYTNNLRSGLLGSQVPFGLIP